MGAGRRVVPAGGGDHQCEGAAVALPHTVARRFRWAARLLASAVRHDRAAGQLARHPGAQDGAGTGGAPAAGTVRTHAAGGPCLWPAMRHAADADGNRRHDRADPGSCEQDAAIHARARSGGTAIQMAADTGASGPARSRRPDGSRHGGMMGSAGRGGCRRTGTASGQEGIARRHAVEDEA
ncbi:hypothetical protein AI27_17110 [Sphingomonas sp. BHC-A]|nr:hypothetical protein AI27_17110 [Sphingomonas sp. BHC-A]